MKTIEIRNLFLQYFEKQGHLIVDSAPLVPIDDESLLWINAGIAPLKKYFDGTLIPNSRRLANSQKCIRTNDIDNVGYTARHHTYFEMMGNFSVGDYFKKEAIAFALEFLTGNEWLNIDVNKLYMTYYPSDLEAKEYWLSLGIKESHIIPLEGNYWEIGTGPCGPCSEIFYDRGEKYGAEGISLLEADVENDRYIEIWNLVFSQYNSKEELSREEYPELPSKNIDTGMGLDRVACIMQGVETNYDTDAFEGIMEKISELSGVKYTGQIAFKVIADHIRTLCLSIADSALPSNEGRGYVIRRILRRAVKFGKRLGLNEPFLYKIVETVNKAVPYYDFSSQISIIKTVIENEELKFYNTIELGEKKLENILSNFDKVSDEDAFLLYDTYGFPIELTVELAREENVEVDIDGFNMKMIEQRERSRSSRVDKNNFDTQSEALLNFKLASEFVGYDILDVNAKIIAIYQDEQFVSSASGQMSVVLDKTPFYATSGGQVSDIGYLNDYEVLSVVKAPHGQHFHFINTDEEVKLGDVHARVDAKNRHETSLNHSATHLLNYVLRQYFGDHIKQHGSYVCSSYLRFDFTHFEAINDDDIINIENNVMNVIKKGGDVFNSVKSIDEAMEMGATALFGEKYGDVVRVQKIGDSLELCGGTHIEDLREINDFAIVSYESKGSGVYRIVASTNHNIDQIITSTYVGLASTFVEVVRRLDEYISSENIDEVLLKELEPLINEFHEIKDENMKFISSSVGLLNYSMIVDAKRSLAKLQKLIRSVDKIFTNYKNKQSVAGLDYSSNVNDINGLNVLIINSAEIPSASLKDLVDKQFEQLNLDAIFAISASDTITFVCKLSDSAISKGLNAGQMVKTAAELTGGKGGGRPNFAQAGGKNIEKIDEVVTTISKMFEC